MPSPQPSVGRVLCVDDEPAIRLILESILRREQWDVEMAEDGFAAWEKIATEIDRFDVVVTDGQMPRLDGLGLVRRLRSHGFAGRVVVFSSTLTADADAKFRSLGVAAVLQKAVASLEQLVAAVKGVAPH